ncbi:hypothetical protein SAMN05421790_101307 [Kroppenstedtia eburnea]|uniref:Uncharacterized protein n=1 Tax=Kroppenstedtia eburnea TaxID=714067 RepID=A0A1N7ISB8_9BACL|nr:hypothetical protein SAMN05421790_101307 [Kroppenstedtia eburnea]
MVMSVDSNIDGKITRAVFKATPLHHRQMQILSVI